MELPEKKEKRIDSLIKSSSSILVVAVVLLCLAPLGLVLMIVCFLYHFETRLLLSRYGEALPRAKRKKLKSASTRYLVTGGFMLLIYIAAIVGFLLSKP